MASPGLSTTAESVSGAQHAGTERPTPRPWPLRLAWGLTLILLTGYHGLAFYNQHVPAPNLLPPAVASRLYWAQWDMFTFIVKRHSAYHFEQWDGEAWVHAPMESWFPFQYCHGPRWNRSTLRKSYKVRQAFLEAACQRSGAARVRAVRESWDVTPGQFKQPKRHLDRDVLQTLDCDTVRDTPTRGAHG